MGHSREKGLVCSGTKRPGGPEFRETGSTKKERGEADSVQGLEVMVGISVLL
jgi:hypothetical protein